MGYDIIIAIDVSQKIKDELSLYDSNPAVALMNSIYITGNYSRIMPKLINDNGVNTLKLQLESVDPRSIRIVLGADLTSSIAYQYSMTKFVFRPEVQLRGVLGRNSVLGVKGSFINDLGVELFYFNAFTPNFFMELESNYYIEKFAPELDMKSDISLIPGK